jgi:hypothetical protein
MQNDIWLDNNEYPDEKDIEAFGYDSPVDYDPLTIGYIGNSRPRFWTPKRIVLLIVVLFLIGVLLLPSLLRLF